MKLVIVFAALVLLVACTSQSATLSEKQVSVVQEPPEPVVSTVREFLVSAANFEFVPSTIEVNKGDIVRLKITAGDKRHGIAIQGYDIRKELAVNQEVVIEFVADKVGEFPFYCSVYCGSGHSAMKGLLIVT